MYHEMFPPVFLALQEEIQNHQALLVNLLQLPKDSSMEMKLAEVAAFCGIILDGFYNEEQVMEICEECIKRLKQARVELIVDISAPIITAKH